MTLLKHSAQYLLARGLPGLLNFAGLALYTRLLAPEEFGRYSLVIAIVGLVDVLFFQWLRLVLGRFLQSQINAPRAFLNEIFALFLLLSAATTACGILVALVFDDHLLPGLIALAVPLLIGQAWFQINLTLAAARLEPLRYGRLLVGKATSALLVGAWLAWIGLGAFAPIVGLLIAHVAAIAAFSASVWKGVRPTLPNGRMMRRHLAYGLPLSVTFALGWILSSSDRVLIGMYLGESAIGFYSAGYDLAYQSIILLLTAVNTAAFPLAVRALERGGMTASMVRVEENGALIVTIAITGAAALSILAPQAAVVLIGPDYRAEAQTILPMVAFAAAISGIKTFHFDVVFHLHAKSGWLLVTAAIAALLNVMLNVLLIPYLGIQGAAWGTVLATSVAAICSLAIGQRLVGWSPLLSPFKSAAYVATTASALTWAGGKVSPGAGGLLCGFFAGALGAVATATIINLAGFKAIVVEGWRTAGSIGRRGGIRRDRP